MKHENRIASVEALRGIAALMVALFHFSNGNIHFLPNGFWLRNIGIYGYLGVEIFFVISGFIIPWSLYKNRYHIRAFFRFLIRRSIRIELPYIASIGLVVLLNLFASRTKIFQGAEFHVTIYQLLSHIIYLPDFFGYKWLQPVYWTLLIEVQFYILMGIVFGILTSRYNWILLGVLLTAYTVPFLLFPFIGLFVMGMVYFLYRARMFSKSGFIIAGSVAIIHTYYTIGFPEALAGMTAILFIEFFSLDNVFTRFFGGISYSLYLVHVPVGGKIINLGMRYIHTVPQRLLLFVFAFAASIFFAWIFHKSIEKPAVNLSKRIAYRTKE